MAAQVEVSEGLRKKMQGVITDELKEQLENAQDHLSDFLQSFPSDMDQDSLQKWVRECQSNLTDEIIETGKSLLTAMFRLIPEFLNELMAMMGKPIQVPIINEIVETFIDPKGIQTSMLDLVTSVLATSLTVPYKLAHSNDAPFAGEVDELLKMDYTQLWNTGAANRARLTTPEPNGLDYNESANLGWGMGVIVFVNATLGSGIKIVKERNKHDLDAVKKTLMYLRGAKLLAEIATVAFSGTVIGLQDIPGPLKDKRFQVWAYRIGYLLATTFNYAVGVPNFSLLMDLSTSIISIFHAISTAELADMELRYVQQKALKITDEDVYLKFSQNAGFAASKFLAFYTGRSAGASKYALIGTETLLAYGITGMIVTRAERNRKAKRATDNE